MADRNIWKIIYKKRTPENRHSLIIAQFKFASHCVIWTYLYTLLIKLRKHVYTLEV